MKIKRDQSTLDMIGSFYFNAGNIRKSLEIFEEAYSLGNSDTVALHLVSRFFVVIFLFSLKARQSNRILLSCYDQLPVSIKFPKKYDIYV